jgi:hypothetical protein
LRLSRLFTPKVVRSAVPARSQPVHQFHLPRKDSKPQESCSEPQRPHHNSSLRFRLRLLFPRPTIPSRSSFQQCWCYPTLRGSSAHSHELQMAITCLQPFLLTIFPLPALLQTAKSSPKASVPVVSTPGIFEMTDPPGGLSLAELASGHFPDDCDRNYGASKAGNWFLALDFNKRAQKWDSMRGAIAGNVEDKGWDDMT